MLREKFSDFLQVLLIYPIFPMLCWKIWAVQLMQNKMGIREVKSIEFFNKTFSVSIWQQINDSGYQENELFHIGWMDHKDQGMFLHQDKKLTKFSEITFSIFWHLRKKVSWFQLFVYIFSKKMWSQKYLYYKQRNP